MKRPYQKLHIAITSMKFEFWVLFVISSHGHWEAACSESPKLIINNFRLRRWKFQLWLRIWWAAPLTRRVQFALHEKFAVAMSQHESTMICKLHALFMGQVAVLSNSNHGNHLWFQENESTNTILHDYCVLSTRSKLKTATRRLAMVLIPSDLEASQLSTIVMLKIRSSCSTTQSAHLGCSQQFLCELIFCCTNQNCRTDFSYGASSENWVVT